MAKLLYQRTSGGRGQRQRLSNAGSMRKQHEIREKRGEKTLQEAGFGCGDPGEQQCGEGLGIFGGKAGAEKQTGEQTGQEDEQQDGSDFSHGEVPL